jgi:hypothetical protein
MGLDHSHAGRCAIAFKKQLTTQSLLIFTLLVASVSFNLVLGQIFCCLVQVPTAESVTPALSLRDLVSRLALVVPSCYRLRVSVLLQRIVPRPWPGATLRTAGHGVSVHIWGCSRYLNHVGRHRDCLPYQQYKFLYHRHVRLW